MVGKIKHIMIDKGISTKELAQLAGINPQTLYNSFSLGTMSSANLQRIAKALDCELVLQDKTTGKIY